MQPTRNRGLEAVDESKRILEGWFEGYNDGDVDKLRELCHYPLVSLGGARLQWYNLDFTVRDEPSEFVPTYRDHGWAFSLVDRWAVHQHTHQKAHLITDFRRLRADGSAYAVGLSRLAIIAKRNSGWGVTVLSSSGMRNPAHVESERDAEITATVTEFVKDLFDEFRDSGSPAESYYNYPFVDVGGVVLSVAETPADRVHGDDSPAEDVELVSMEVLPPQAGDKVVVDVNVEYDGPNGSRQRVGGVLLVTKQDGSWGLQLRSVPEDCAVVP